MFIETVTKDFEGTDIKKYKTHTHRKKVSTLPARSFVEISVETEFKQAGI